MDMLSELSDSLEENELGQNIVKQSIVNHFHELCQWCDKYFRENTTPLDIIAHFTVSNTHHLSSDLNGALGDLSSDHGLKIAFDTKITLVEFWISVAKEYPQISVDETNVLSPFGTTCFCERAFSALSYIKK